MSVAGGVVFPILPSYTRGGELDESAVASYVRYLEAHAVPTVMTTAGTSQFGLLSLEEVEALSEVVATTFTRRTILGAPPLAERLLLPFLDGLVAQHPGVELLIIYPERFYGYDDVTAYIRRVARHVKAPMHLHGLPFRLATGGYQDVTADLVQRLAVEAPGLIGMKEECSTMEAGFVLCDRVSRGVAFEFIVAGGSMRRYLLMHAAGATSFLAGVGSLFPSLDLAFYDHIRRGDLPSALTVLRAVETPTFDVFMELGWHRSLRHAARVLGLVRGPERAPFKELGRRERRAVEAVVEQLRTQVGVLSSEGLV